MFYVTQANVVVTRLVGVMFMVGSTLAIGLSILLLKLTFDYPLLRIVAASALFFGSVYLMRILKVGIIFFIVAIVVIYVQTFVDRTDQAELLIRAVLWVWVAVNYPIAITLLVNTLLLPVEPQHQLKAEIHLQLDAVDARLGRLCDDAPPDGVITPQAIQQGALTLQKLLKFATMRDARYRHEMAYHLACIATVSRVYRAAGDLPPGFAGLNPVQRDALRQLRANCARWTPRWATTPRIGTCRPPLHRKAIPFRCRRRPRKCSAHWRRLPMPAWPRPPGRPPNRRWSCRTLTNPAYVRFALKTLLAVLVCYAFYTSVDWQGAHTIMLTCVIIALPSLGASMQRALLRVGGALTGSALALFMVVFVVPHLDSIADLLLMTLPVVALAAWIAAGSERIGYAGVQILFTFSLALLARFGPTIDLTEIRDRMAGILLGVAVATIIQMSFWPEAEGDALRRKLAGMLSAVGQLLQPAGSDSAPPGHLSYSQQQLQAWAVLSDCEDTLARVTLEPNWQEGEQAQFTVRAQAVLAQGREIMLAANSLHNALAASSGPVSHDREAARAFQARAATLLSAYAVALAANPPSARAPQAGDIRVPEEEELTPPVRLAMDGLADQLRGLPDWYAAAPPSPVVFRESRDAG